MAAGSVHSAAGVAEATMEKASLSRLTFEVSFAAAVLDVLLNSVFAAAPDGRMLVRIDKGRAAAELPSVATVATSRTR